MAATRTVAVFSPQNEKSALEYAVLNKQVEVQHVLLQFKANPDTILTVRMCLFISLMCVPHHNTKGCLRTRVRAEV